VGRIKVKRMEFPIPKADDGHIAGSYGFNAGIRGKPVWFPLHIDQIEKYHLITLKASFNYKPSASNPNEHRCHSRVGMWTAVKDTPSLLSNSSSSDSYQHGESSEFNILLNQWRFGKEAQITFELRNSPSYGAIQIAVCAMPWFLPNEETKLTITLECVEEGDMLPFKIDEKVISFNCVEGSPEVPSNMILKLFDEFGAFNIDGNGNSVHPKQLYTSEALKEQLMQHPNKKVDLAYIGTDTTENIRTLIRRMKDDIGLEKIKHFYVYYKEGWDTELLKTFPNLKLDRGTTSLNEKLKLIKLPKDGSLPKKIASVDYTVSTYVTPWATADEKNRTQYIELLNSLMEKKNSKLISIDPENSSNVIRDYCDDFNLHTTYIEQLDLMPVDEIATSSKVIDCTIWEKKSEVGE